MKEVNADLYQIMTENECHLCMKNKTVTAWICVGFHDLSDFIYAVGADWFSEGGADIKLFESYVAIDLNEIIEGEGHLLASYETCFPENEWERYKDDILKEECENNTKIVF